MFPTEKTGFRTPVTRRLLWKLATSPPSPMGAAKKPQDEDPHEGSTASRAASSLPKGPLLRGRPDVLLLIRLAAVTGEAQSPQVHTLSHFSEELPGGPGRWPRNFCMLQVWQKKNKKNKKKKINVWQKR